MNLVTGASGHIGNVLIRELLKRGKRVRALVRPGKGLPAGLVGIDAEVAYGDLLNEESLERAMEGVETVYHLAAKISLTTGPDLETTQVNLEGTRNILAAVKRKGVRRLVYASSIYSLQKPASGNPIDENQQFETEQSQGTYDASKAMASIEVQMAAAEGMDVVIVCPTAVTGPYDFHNSEAGRAVKIYMRPGLKFIVDGAYDFVDVRDAADGFIRAAEKGKSGEKYILSGERLTVAEVARIVGEASGGWHSYIKVPIAVAYLAADLMPIVTYFRGGEPLFTRYSLDAICSNSQISHEKATKNLGYSARPAREAILDSVCWFQAQARGENFIENAAVEAT
jgi:dihydroflavonol-4-reductase